MCEAEHSVLIETLTDLSFEAFGDVIEVQPQPNEVINQGNCNRYTDLARLEFAGGGRAGISLFQARPCAVPLTLLYVERHPLGNQAFLPMTGDPFLIVVAEDNDGKPARPKGFVTMPGQGVNYHRGFGMGC